MKPSVNPLLFALLFSSIAHSMELEKLKKQIESVPKDAKAHKIGETFFELMDKKKSLERGPLRKEISDQIPYLRKEIAALPPEQYASIQPYMIAFSDIDSDGETMGDYSKFRNKRTHLEKLEPLINTQLAELKKIEEQDVLLDQKITALQKERAALNKIYSQKKDVAEKVEKGRKIVILLQEQDRQEALKLKTNAKLKKKTLLEELESLVGEEKIAQSKPLNERTPALRKVNDRRAEIKIEIEKLTKTYETYKFQASRMKQWLNPEKYPSVSAKVTTAISSTPSMVTNAVVGTFAVLASAVGLNGDAKSEAPVNAQSSGTESSDTE